MKIRTHLLVCVALFAAAFALTHLFAADAPAAPPPAPTLQSVTAERDALKTQVAALQAQVDQLSTAAALLQQQRNAALDAEVQRAMAAAKK